MLRGSSAAACLRVGLETSCGGWRLCEGPWGDCVVSSGASLFSEELNQKHDSKFCFEPSVNDSAEPVFSFVPGSGAGPGSSVVVRTPGA